jgi:hypothetical protein
MQEHNERTKLLYRPVKVTRDTMIGVTVPRVPDQRRTP